jgi:hypothetical protein
MQTPTSPYGRSGLNAHVDLVGTSMDPIELFGTPTKKQRTEPHSDGDDAPVDLVGTSMDPIELFGTPTKKQRTEPHSDGYDAPGTPGHEFSLMGLLHKGRGGVSVLSGPPPTPFKTKSKTKSKSKRSSTSDDPEDLPSNALLGLQILAVDWKWIDNLGTGSFGTVDEVVFPPPSGSPPGTPCSPPVAMKTVKPSPKQGPKALLEEASHIGSQGCAPGVAVTNDDGYLIIFTSVAVPLSKMRKIGSQLLEEVIKLMKPTVFLAPLGVILDLKLENLGFFPKGTATVIPDQKGQPSIGPNTTENNVLVLDLGNFFDAEDTDATYGVFLEEHDLATVEEQTKFRVFKFEVMEALLRNQNATKPKDEKPIVARICTKFGYRYAGGAQY